MEEELELIEISVGEKFPLFLESAEKNKGREYAVFEASGFNQGYMFMCYLSNIREMEVEGFRNSPIQMKVILGDDNMVIPMVKIGRFFLYEMVFDPTLYDDNRALQFVESNNILSFYLIDSQSGKLMAIRQSNFPLKMIQLCKISWSKAILDIDFSAKFGSWYSHIAQNYTLDAMWDRATYLGRMGETYDLNEIKMPFGG